MRERDDRRSMTSAIIGAASAASAALVIAVTGWALNRFGFNIVTYQFEPKDFGALGIAAAPWGVAVFLSLLIGTAALTSRAGPTPAPPSGRAAQGCPQRVETAVVFFAALLALLAGWLLVEVQHYVVLAAVIIFAGVALAGASRVAERRDADGPPPLLSTAPSRGALRFAAPVVILLAVAAATAWQTGIQVTTWRHFGLGIADFGFYTRDLESCLPWSHIADRFRDTRLAYHFEPLFFALAPVYAVFRSPLMLMILGPLAINAGALAFYRLALARGCSVVAACGIALAWLALPSVSRMPYAGGYGFESVHLAVPLVAMTVSAGVRGRWRAAHAWLALSVLVQETLVGFAIGWAAYLLLFTRRRRDGVIIIVAAGAYFALATQVIVPHFAASGSYSRLDLIGATTPAELLAQVVRPRAVFYVLALGAPLAFWLARGWRIALAGVPTLLLVMALSNPDFLCIRYWHQSAILPVLFAASVVGLTAKRHTLNASSASRRGGRHETATASCGTVQGSTPPLSFLGRGLEWSAASLLATVLIWHAVLGFSPFSQSYRLVRTLGLWRDADPRMAAIEFVRQHYSPRQTSVLATQRAAAHFLDYRAIAPLSDESLRAPLTADVIVVDEADEWDPIVSGGRLELLLSTAARAGFRSIYAAGTLQVLAAAPGE
ncbi:MAG: DUF2079 domain-containing protein [Planctomycetota bacterium]|nr:MAG: DUF2079 domain-containing protein [Planctomycetota bacterium]